MKSQKELFKEFRGQNYLEINLNFQDFDKLSIAEADDRYQKNLKLLAKLFSTSSQDKDQEEPHSAQDFGDSNFEGN